MTVRVRSLQGGRPPLLQFSDTFDVNFGSSWGPNYIYAIGSQASNAVTAGIRRNGFQAGGTGIGTLINVINNGGGSNYVLVAVPLPIFFNVFTKERTFSRLVWNSGNANVATFLALKFSNLATFGSGTETMADYYALFVDRALGGQVTRLTQAGTSILRAATWGTPVAGDTIEFRATVSGAQTTLQVFRNGVQDGADIVDAVGIVSGGPGIGESASNAAGSSTIRDFAAGIF